jgi:hypothetical protein
VVQFLFILFSLNKFNLTVLQSGKKKEKRSNQSKKDQYIVFFIGTLDSRVQASREGVLSITY